jgi:hypothetical protein
MQKGNRRTNKTSQQTDDTFADAEVLAPAVAASMLHSRSESRAIEKKNKDFPVHNVRRMGGAELQLHSFLILALDEVHKESSRDSITGKCAYVRDILQ